MIPILPPANLRGSGPASSNGRIDPSQLWENQTFRSVLSKFLHHVVVEMAMSPADRAFVQANALINNAYYRGRQYLDMLTSGTGSGTYQTTMNAGGAESVRLATTSSTSFGTTQDLLINYQLPIFQGDVDKYLSVLGTRSPNAQGLYDVPGDPKATQVQRLANRLVPYMKKAFNVDQNHADLILQRALSGPVWGGVFVQRFNNKAGGAAGAPNDPQTFKGTIQKPQGEVSWNCPKCGTSNSQADVIEMQGRCLQCGNLLSHQDMQQPDLANADFSATTMGGPPAGADPNSRWLTTYIQGSVTLVEVPYWCKDPESYPWVHFAQEQDRWSLLAKYKRAGFNIDPDKVNFMGRQALGPGIGAIHQGQSHRFLQTPRAGIAASADLSTSSMGAMGTNHSGYPTRNYWREEQIWVHPDLYSWFDDSSNDPTGEVGAYFKENFHRGARQCFVNSIPVATFDETPSEHWYQVPGPSEGAYYDATFTCYREIIDAINVVVDQAVRVIQHATGEVFFDGELISEDRLKSLPPSIARWIPVVMSKEETLSNFIHKVQGAELPEQLPKLLEMLVSLAREAVGITPALFGAGPGDETARAAEIRRTQALAQFNPTWQAVRKFWAEIYRRGARLIARNAGQDGALWTRSAMLNPEASPIILKRIKILLDENWSYFTEEAVPLSPGARRNWIEDVLRQTPPEVLAAMGMINPATGEARPQNLNLIKEVVQLDDWWLPSYNAYQRIHDMIGRIVAGEGDQMMVADPMLIPPPLVVEIMSDWLISDAGADLEIDNPAAWQEVRMAIDEWASLIPPPVPLGPDGQPLPPPPPGEEGMPPGEPMPPEEGMPPGGPSPPQMMMPPGGGPDPNMLQPPVEGEGGLGAELPPQELLDPEMMAAQIGQLPGQFVDLAEPPPNNLRPM